jgi:hypothetical protein
MRGRSDCGATAMKVFIAHSKADAASEAAAAATRLRTRGYRVFFDEDSLPVGEDYDRRIQLAIRSTDVFVYLLTPGSIAAGSYARTELKLAKQRWPNPVGRVLVVVVSEVDLDAADPYLTAATVLRPSGDVPAEIVHDVDRIAGALRARTRRKLVASGVAIAAAIGGVAGVVAYVWPEAPRSRSATELEARALERLKNGAPGEGDAYLARVVARNGDRAPITFGEVSIESRLTGFTAEVSHERDNQYWLTVPDNGTQTWPLVVRWSRDGRALREGELPDALEWRLCWAVSQVRDCGRWMVWKPTGAFEAPRVRAIDKQLASRLRALATAPRPPQADETGFWVGLAEPSELGRLRSDGTIADRVALAGTPVRMTRARQLAFVATANPDEIVTIDLTRLAIERRDKIALPSGRSATAFSMAYDGTRLWILFDDNKGPEALRTLDRNGKWHTPPYEGPLGNTLDELQLTARDDVVLAVTSGTPHYLYRLASDRLWELSGHDIPFIGCLSALAATPTRWVGIACGFDLIELVPHDWPRGAPGTTPVNAAGAFTDKTIQQGLGSDYEPYHWDADLLAMSDASAVVALTRRDRQTYKLEESAVVYRNSSAVWRPLFKDKVEIIEVSVVDAHALIATRAGGVSQWYIAKLD